MALERTRCVCTQTNIPLKVLMQTLNTNQPENRIFAERRRIAPAEEEEVGKMNLNNFRLER